MKRIIEIIVCRQGIRSRVLDVVRGRTSESNHNSNLFSNLNRVCLPPGIVAPSGSND